MHSTLSAARRRGASHLLVDRAAAALEEAAALEARGAWSAAERVYRRTVARLRDARPRPRALGEALTRLGWVLQEQGRYRAATAVLRDAIDATRRRPLDHAHAINALGVCCKYLARFDEAAALYRRALQVATRERDLDLAASVHHNLGGLAHAAGRAAEGERPAREAVRLRTRRWGARHPAVAADLAALAAVLDQQNKFGEARRLYTRAIRIFERVHGDAFIEIAASLNNLGALEQRRGRLDTAERSYRRALAILARHHGRNHPQVGFVANNLATLLLVRGRLDEALSFSRKALRLFRGQLGAAHPNVAVCLNTYSRALRRRGRDREADRIAREAQRIARRNRDPRFELIST